MGIKQCVKEEGKFIIENFDDPSYCANAINDFFANVGPNLELNFRNVQEFMTERHLDVPNCNL